MTTPRQTLVLGGTSWLGGAVARLALAQGQKVTCLARGESGPVPAGARLVEADRWRPEAYDAVIGRDWDAVVDVSWQPELVRSALAALADRAAHWVYVSSVSAYRDHSAGGTDELHDPWTGAGPASAEDYGPAKVACESACAAAVPDHRLLVARAGLIAGYGDLSDRFGYWPARIARASREVPVLVPPLDTPVQVVDVEDLAGWLVAAACSGVAGTYDAVGEVHRLDSLLRDCAEVAGTDPVYAVADQEWLLGHGVAPWAGPESLPLWLPVPEYARMTTHPNDAARRAGLTLRPLRETVVGSLAWERERGLDRERGAGLTPANEAQLVATLKEPH